MSTLRDFSSAVIALALFVGSATAYVRANVRLDAREREVQRRDAQTAPFKASMSHSGDSLSA
jgi:hypothetical protein